MGEQRNLTEENVEELRAVLDKMKEKNDQLQYRFYKQEEHQPDAMNSEHRAIIDRLDAIERKLDLIFGGHVLMDGKFVNIMAQQSPK